MIVAVVIAIYAITNKPEKEFGTSTGFEPMASALALHCSTILALRRLSLHGLIKV